MSNDEEGKTVVRNGEKIGRVVDVEHGTAYVDPDPGITETMLSKLGWADRDEDTYPLQEESVERVTDDEIQLKASL